VTASLWFVALLAAYGFAEMLFVRLGRRAWSHPVLLPSAACIIAIVYFGLPFSEFEQGTRVFHFLLMAAVAALAIPLYRNIGAIRKDPAAVVAAVVGGSIAGSGSAVAFSILLGGQEALSATLAVKSVTTPIAIIVAEQVGGIPSISAAVVISTGLVIAIAGPWFLRLFGVAGDITVGIAMGTAGHGLGMAEAVRRSELMGAAAAFAMAANGLITAVLLPVFWP